MLAFGWTWHPANGPFRFPLPSLRWLSPSKRREIGRKGPTARFHDYLERYAPGASLHDRRKQMYALRSDILHGSGLMEMDRDSDFGWSPPEQCGKDLMEELWGLTKLSMRNWLKTPP